MVGTLIGLKETKRNSLDPSHFVNATILAAIFGTVGARLFYVAQNFGFYSRHPADIIAMWKGGSVSFGALLGVIFALLIYFRVNRLPTIRYLDVYPVPFGIGIVFGRIGCFLTGCCYGKPSDLPFAVRYPRGSIPYNDQLQSLALTLGASASLPVHPVQIYEAMELLIVSIAFYVFIRPKKDGIRFLFFVLCYAFLRLVNDFVRADADRGFIYKDLSVSSFMSIAILLIGTFLVAYSARKRTA